MRTSRISQETSKIVHAASAARRSTRASALRSDIEDAVPPPRKRKREETPRTPIKRSPGLAVTIKKETKETLTLSPTADRKLRKPARQIKNEDTGEVEIHPPNDWDDVYATVKEMRITGPAKDAAVDTMGCERLAEKNASPKARRYQTLTALMLSSQTKDTTNAVAMKRLCTELPPYKDGAPAGLNLENILAVDPKLLNELIWVVGFHNNKTKYIKATAEILRDQWDGDIPNTIEGLVSLPGVGPKMGYLCLSSAWGRTEGIGVDVHVHRITNLWGWHKTKGPEETRLALQTWLPRELWYEINWLLVGLGQTICLPVGRKCGECDLGLKGLCKSAERAKVNIGRRTQVEKIEEDEKGDVLGKIENIKTEKLVGDIPMNADL
jgi:endonuclease-3